MLHSFLFCLFSERYCGQKCGQIEIFGRICKWGESTNGFVMRNVGGVVAGLLGVICPKSAPIAVSKTDNIKIITPEANQFADAWDIDYRKYHDLFVPENKKAVIAVSLGV